MYVLYLQDISEKIRIFNEYLFIGMNFANIAFSSVIQFN